MNQNRAKNTKNRRERNFGFIYVSLLFIITTGICCASLFYYNFNDKTIAQKKFAIAKMDRIRSFQSAQNEEIVIVDSIFNRIKDFDPSINASYEENDIKYYLNDMKNIYEKNVYDARYKIFYHIASFYTLWFDDKKELWSKKQNIAIFKKNLEDCEIGLEKKKEELKSAK